MSGVVLGVITVVVICGVGLAIAYAKGSAESRIQEAEFRKLCRELFPNARVKLWPLCRGSFGAQIEIDGEEYVFTGDYLREEGGDGYMHIRKKGGDAEGEISRVSLDRHIFHWPVLSDGLRSLSAHRAQNGKA